VLEGYSSRNTNSAMGFNVLVQVFQDNPFDQGNPFFFIFTARYNHLSCRPCPRVSGLGQIVVAQRSDV